jgi:hypothetical protein
MFQRKRTPRDPHTVAVELRLHHTGAPNYLSHPMLLFAPDAPAADRTLAMEWLKAWTAAQSKPDAPKPKTETIGHVTLEIEPVLTSTSERAIRKLVRDEIRAAKRETGECIGEATLELKADTGRLDADLAAAEEKVAASIERMRKMLQSVGAPGSEDNPVVVRLERDVRYQQVGGNFAYGGIVPAGATPSASD